MSSLIGTKPHQVPTNGDLGRLAFLDVIGLSDVGTYIPTIASSSSISPVTSIVYVSGSNAINTIVPPTTFVNGGQLTLIPTGAFVLSTDDNVAIAVSAEISRPIILTYESTFNKWYPSYSNSVNRVTITPPTTSSTFTLVAGKTLTVNKSLTLDGTDDKTLTVNKSITLDGADDKTLKLNASVEINTTSSNAVTLDLRAGGTVVYTSDPVGKLSGGGANQVAYQTAANTTSFIAAPTTANTVLSYNGTNIVWAGSGLTPTPIKTLVTSPALTPYVASANDLVRCNTTDAAFSVKLPAAPADGTIIGFMDVSDGFTSYPLTILANGKTIEGDSTAFVLDVSGAYLELLYVTSTGNWKMLQTPSLSGGVPISSTTQLGFVKVDGTTITVNSSGVISSIGGGGGGGGGGLTPTAIKISAYTAATYELVRCNTTSAAFSVSFPATPADGSRIGILDVNGTFGINNLTLLPLGSKTIEGDASSFSLDVNGTYIEFLYVDSTSNWRLLETPVNVYGRLVPTDVKTSSYLAASNDLIRCNTTSTAFSVSLPATPIDGVRIGILDVANTFNTRNLTVIPLGGKTVEGNSDSIVLDLQGTYIELLYNASTLNWKLLETPNGLGTPGIDYLVPNVTNIFTKPQRPSMSAETAPVSNVVTWDLTSDQIFRINLNANITTFNLTGTLSSLVGNQYELLIRYNGGTSITWNSNMKWSNGSAPVLTSVSSKLDIITFMVATTDGTNFYLVNTGFKLNVG